VIGGTATYNDILEHPACAEFRGLIRAVSKVGSPAIRAVGTPAGNLGTAAPAADCATMLLTLGAQVELRSSASLRTVPLEGFYLGRGRTVRTPEELITAIRIPALCEGEGTGYFRVSRRKAQDIGKVLVGCRVKVAGGRVAEARISLGAVNECIARARSLEETVCGKTAAEAAGYLKRTFPEEAGLRESYFREYKEQVTSSAVARSFALALEDAAERSGLWQS
jgi:CO/xanthine dehydrogenase FAD-binding subunit